MDRRSLIKHITFAASAGVFPPTLFIGCRSDDYQFQFLTDSQFDLLDDFSEIILPTTEKSPGAKAAKVSHFIDRYVYHCFDPEKKQEFIEQLTAIDILSNGKFNSDFLSLSMNEKIDCVEELEKENTYHSFKSIILFAYFTSEVGVTQALHYVAVPGKYEGDIYYREGDRGWFN